MIILEKRRIPKLIQEAYHKSIQIYTVLSIFMMAIFFSAKDQIINILVVLAIQSMLQ